MGAKTLDSKILEALVIHSAATPQIIPHNKKIKKSPFFKGMKFCEQTAALMVKEAIDP